MNYAIEPVFDEKSQNEISEVRSDCNIGYRIVMERWSR